MSRVRGGTKGVPRADREQQILRVAAEVFGSEGFAGTSVAAVAEAAGISKPLVYQYFGSKEGLFGAVFHEEGTAFAEELERTAATGAVGIERGLRTLEGIFAFLETRPWTWRILFDRTAPADGPVAAELAGYTERITSLAFEGVGELLHLAGNEDPLDLSALVTVWTNVSDTLVAWWLDHPDQTAEQMTARCVRLFEAVLGVDLSGYAVSRARAAG